MNGTVEHNSFSIFKKKLILGRFSMEVRHSPLFLFEDLDTFRQGASIYI